MALLKFICAVVTRLLFILLSLIGVWRVTWVKNNNYYWFLTILYLPLVAEMMLTLRRRKGKDYKWLSPAILLFLISIIPTIWILELHHQQNKTNDDQCRKLDSTESIKSMIDFLRNTTSTDESFKDSVRILSSVCANDWILALHQIVLILLILGKWLLPIGEGITRDELSQLLLIFVGIAADILEFTSETIIDVKDKSPEMVYVILAVWTWSMLQFPLHLSVLSSRSEDASEGSFLKMHRTSIWGIVESLFIQDGPFLIVRMTIMFHFDVYHQMLVFFAIKNFLVVILNFYRLWVICQDYRSDL
ncbi:transmembrane protein 26b [Chanos chanos]|uniref:Transmembrane protein 26b n=1 Tax=Chanos chanos TaxID=29144 RepID=A0A6J2VFS5_CHACN|nr:transmembrane protein 26-like [Chanos chanos]